jgi:choriolysin H
MLSYFNKLYLAQDDKNFVFTALSKISEETCVTFVQRISELDYVEIINGAGCFSGLGRLGGRQELSLNKTECFEQGTIMHEFIHALG